MNETEVVSEGICKQVNTAHLLLLHALLPANTSEARLPADEALETSPMAMPLPALPLVSPGAEEDAWGDETGKCCDHSDHFVTTVWTANLGGRIAGGPVGDPVGNTGASRRGIPVNSALRQRLLSSQQASVSGEAGQRMTGSYSLQAYCLGE